MSTSIENAEEILRPAQDGLPYLRHDRASELSLEPGSLTLDGNRIAGFEADASADRRIDASGCSVIPGLVDCHTHLPFAGWRAGEYGMKVTGASYEDIARSGGGIRSSSRAWASMDDETVVAQATGLAAEMLAHGTTTFECKSGYGLSREAELRSLLLARRLGEEVAQDTTRTGLLAHAVPDGHTPDSWMDVVEEMLGELVEQTAPTALDIYVESVAFTNDHLRRMGRLAAAHGLDLRAHVEQFNSNRSVPVALEEGARSVDHLACLDPEDLPALAAAECAAVLLPGAEFLGDEHVAPARELADAGAICVLATDANPGTSPVVSLPLVIGLAVRRYRWTALEALLACTLNAAWVLRRSGEAGSLERGKRADVVLLDGPVEHVPYRFGHNPVVCTITGGEISYLRPGAEWRLR
jgi:imidazolonepropionase